ncbi:taste receptor type 2 member 8-like [Sceloporus undulatus]|uniref:taste receptor type 2 member 8-like n=1 Tax=Sceloporus undulatus TaxID=8520 RepID=UPI001C4BC1C5|nr:taste receptor type 2 member 8-like [Sceloporus undulatus]
MGSNSTSPLDILVWIFIGIVYTVSLLGNGFITIVQGHQWLRHKKMLPCDVLLTSLSTSRFVMQLSSSVNILLYLISPETHAGSSRQQVLNVIWMFSNLASLWCATWLSVFYCIKVTNFANHVFLWLKPRINMLAPRLLGMSVVISSILSLPSVVEYLGYQKQGNLTEPLPGRANQSEIYNSRFVNYLPLYVMFSSINFSISIPACTLLLTSLWKHTKNLRKSGVGGKDARTHVHINVIIPMLFYVFFYLVYLVSITIIASDVVKFEGTERLVVDILATTFPCAHSIILILTNPKLKEMAAHVLNIRQRAS